ncbi:MAG TPA: PLD nuclease N-terminal domain-containing protein [Verrucomicrobiae bacterium]|nr:PLD nuclease N-terminal domain-containing protein [Verrucomicrobiae bacterium]
MEIVFVLALGLGMFALIAAIFGFWIWMLIDCIKHEASEGNDKIIWVLVIIFTNWIGALIYYFVRRPERLRAAVLSRLAASRRQSAAP